MRPLKAGASGRASNFCSFSSCVCSATAKPNSSVAAPEDVALRMPLPLDFSCRDAVGRKLPQCGRDRLIRKSMPRRLTGPMFKIGDHDGGGVAPLWLQEGQLPGDTGAGPTFRESRESLFSRKTQHDNRQNSSFQIKKWE